MITIPCDINTRLQSPVSEELQAYILKRCWNETLDTADLAKYQQYFHHYQAVCQQSSTDDVGNLTHWHLIQAFEHIEVETFEKCAEKLRTLLTQSDDPRLKLKDAETFASHWILETGKALLLLDLTEWKGDQTLKQHLEREHFVSSTQDDSYRIPVSLNLRNLQRIGGLKIRWTGLLSEHLSLENEDTQLAVFHQGRMLSLMENSGLYPVNVSQEVRLTFGMLVPRDDAKSRDWFGEQKNNPKRRGAGSSSILDPTFDSCRGLRPGERSIRRLDYFRDRMISVKDLYDCHEPQSLMQHLRDYRRPAQRWGFLIAILVFLFGTGQLIEGAIQCYRSYYPVA